MESRSHLLLVASALLSAAAAFLHVGCIAFGAPWYRMLGAGEPMASLAQAGSPIPTAISLALAVSLGLAAVYAWSGAGLMRRLPLLRPTLCIITAVYLFRGLAFGVFVPLVPDQPFSFWAWSSALSLLAGLLHFGGLRGVWTDLDERPDEIAY